MSNPGFIPADKIPVSLFREILIWPLALHLGDDQSHPEGLSDAVTQTIDRITRLRPQNWRPVDDPLKHIPPPDNPADLPQWRADAYAEGVYFHEFVQSFLFSTRKQRPSLSSSRKTIFDLDQAPFRLFQRTDVRRIVVELADNKPLNFNIERLNLYLFRTGAAVVVIEIRHTGELRLSDVLTFHDLFRRVYPPFARHVCDGVGQSELSPELVVKSVVWQTGTDRDDVPPFVIGTDTAARLMDKYLREPSDDDSTRRRRFVPIFEHWRWLLKDTLPLAPDDELCDPRWWKGEGRWHQIVDERMPTIATVSVSGLGGNPRYYYDRTRPGDLVRLCFADKFEPAPYTYDRSFLHDFEAKNVYGRFREGGTLFLASGYAFVAYGACDRDKSGFSFFEDVIGTHMRRHYFQMGLLAHFELASLLAFSSRISRAVEHHDDPDPEDFEKRMEVIEDEFLQFIHRFRFTGVSNHLQAQELLDLWRRHLRLNEIFEDLHTEISSATRYLSNRATARNARMTERLSLIATFGVIFGLAFSFLGMNVLFDSSKLGHPSLLAFAILFWTSNAFMATGLVGLRQLRKLSQGQPRQSPILHQTAFERRLEKLLVDITAGMAIVSLGLALGYFFLG
jgi:hypothetical protein